MMYRDPDRSTLLLRRIARYHWLALVPPVLGGIILLLTSDRIWTLRGLPRGNHPGGVVGYGAIWILIFIVAAYAAAPLVQTGVSHWRPAMRTPSESELRIAQFLIRAGTVVFAYFWIYRMVVLVTV